MYLTFKSGRLAGAAALAATLLHGGPVAAQSGSQAKVELTAAKSSNAGGERKVCLSETKMGSRIARKVCRTAAEWEVERQSRAQKALEPAQRF